MTPILVLNGDPHAEPDCLVWAFAKAYENGCCDRPEVSRLDTARLYFPLLRNPGECSLISRGYHRAHRLGDLERNKPGLVGVSPIRATMIGGVGRPRRSYTAAHNRMARLGREGR